MLITRKSMMDFKGVYEKAIQRGGVFDAKHRDAFSSESERRFDLPTLD